MAKRRATPGTKQVNVELADAIREALDRFRAARGESIRDVIEQALVRHFANPPVLPHDQPLPPLPPPESKPARKPRGK